MSGGDGWFSAKRAGYWLRQWFSGVASLGPGSRLVYARDGLLVVRVAHILPACYNSSQRSMMVAEAEQRQK